jgi:hypothetical protein
MLPGGVLALGPGLAPAAAAGALRALAAALPAVPHPRAPLRPGRAALAPAAAPQRPPRASGACAWPAALIGGAWRGHATRAAPLGPGGGNPTATPRWAGAAALEPGAAPPPAPVVAPAAEAALALPPRVKGIGRKMLLRQVGFRGLRCSAKEAFAHKPQPHGGLGIDPRSCLAPGNPRQINRSIIRRLARRATIGVPM